MYEIFLSSRILISFKKSENNNIKNQIRLKYCLSCRVLIYFSFTFQTVRRVAPQFSIPPPPLTEVMLGADLNLTCVAVGSPMPYVKWRKGSIQELTPEDKLPIGINTLELANIQESANYTCIAASVLGIIEATAQVKVQCKY